MNSNKRKLDNVYDQKVFLQDLETQILHRDITQIEKFCCDHEKYFYENYVPFKNKISESVRKFILDCLIKRGDFQIYTAVENLLAVNFTDLVTKDVFLSMPINFLLEILNTRHDLEGKMCQEEIMISMINNRRLSDLLLFIRKVGYIYESLYPRIIQLDNVKLFLNILHIRGNHLIRLDESIFEWLRIAIISKSTQIQNLILTQPSAIFNIFKLLPKSYKEIPGNHLNLLTLSESGLHIPGIGVDPIYYKNQCITSMLVDPSNLEYFDFKELDCLGICELYLRYDIMEKSYFNIAVVSCLIENIHNLKYIPDPELYKNIFISLLKYPTATSLIPLFRSYITRMTRKNLNLGTCLNITPEAFLAILEIKDLFESLYRHLNLNDDQLVYLDHQLRKDYLKNKLSVKILDGQKLKTSISHQEFITIYKNTITTILPKLEKKLTKVLINLISQYL